MKHFTVTKKKMIIEQKIKYVKKYLIKLFTLLQFVNVMIINTI